MDKLKVERSLSSKGFRRFETHHTRFIYYTTSGKKTTVITKTSHGSSKSLSDHLISAMAKQCRLKKTYFEDLVNCPLTREEYEKILIDENHIKL